MSAAHSQGLLQVGEQNESKFELFADGKNIAMVRRSQFGLYPNSEADARRLLACWNSCDGVQTDLLEQVPGIAGSTMPYRVLRMQHAELLVKLQMAVARIEDMLKDDDGQAWDEAGKFLLIVKPIIEQATSGSAS